MKKLCSIILVLAVVLSVFVPVKTVQAKACKTVWVGDSRAVGLKKTVKTKSCKFIAKGGMSYRWFKETAIPKLKKTLKKNPDRDVVINMGVNDCANILVGGVETSGKYIKDINKLVKKYPDTRFYFLSVNPVDGNYPTSYNKKGYLSAKELNKKINKFNKTIKKKCKASYIDCSSHLKDKGFSTIDGIHYTAKTYQEIYDYTMEYIDSDYEVIYDELCEIRWERLNKWGWVWCKPFCKWLQESL